MRAWERARAGGRGLAWLGTLACSTAAAAEQAGARDLAAYKEAQIPGGDLAVIAYGVMWLAIGVFVWRVAGQQARTAREVQALADRLDAWEAEQATGDRS